MLTIKAIEAAKSKDKPYKLPDFGGLYLYISTSGTKSWRFDYQYNGKRKTLTIGKYPYVSLSDAREQKEAAKKMLFDGLDPSLEKKKKILVSKIANGDTFRGVATEWFNTKKRHWSVKTREAIIKGF